MKLCYLFCKKNLGTKKGRDKGADRCFVAVINHFAAADLGERAAGSGTVTRANSTAAGLDS